MRNLPYNYILQQDSRIPRFYKKIIQKEIMKKMKKQSVFAAAMLLLTGMGCLCGCGNSNAPAAPGAVSNDVVEQSADGAAETLTDNQFVITLYPEFAPITCENFESLVTDGFYNGLTFHRVIEGFMAQGGDPEGTGMGGNSRTIYGEFSQNGFEKNTLSHTRGVVSMARAMDPDSASSQFFICYSDDDVFLDGQYAAFGRVTEGMNVVDDYLKVERSVSNGELSSPNTPIAMDTVEMIDKDSDGHPRAKVTMKDFLPADNKSKAE